MRNFCLFVGVVPALALSAAGCQSREEPKQDETPAAVSSPGVAEQLVAKERELVAREQAVRDAEKERLAQKELELSKREAELDRMAQEARPGAKPTSSAPSDDDSGSEDTSVTVQLRVNMTKPDGHAWDVGGGAPDPEITLQAPTGASLVERSTDTLTPTVRFKVKLKKGDSVAITASDKDAVASDPIGSLTVVYSGHNTTQSGALGAAQATVVFAK